MEQTNGTGLRVLVIDDHPVVRAGVCAWLTGLSSGITVATGDTLAAVHTRPGGDADVIVLDLQLADGTVTLADVRGLVAAGRRIVILTQHTDPGTVRALLEAGARSVLSKEEGPRHCLAAVRAAARDQAYLGELLAGAIITDERAERPRLSPRETETLKLYSYGCSRQQVADIMGVQEETVKTNLKRVAEKYERAGRSATERHAFTVRALEDGIVTVAELGAQVDRWQP